jgi:hypothetical protein
MKMLDVGMFLCVSKQFIFNDQACDIVTGNKDWYEMYTFVEFPHSNIAGTLLVVV